MSTIYAKNNSSGGIPLTVDVKSAVVPRPAHKVSDRFVSCDIIVARRHWHLYDVTCLLENEKYLFVTIAMQDYVSRDHSQVNVKG